MTARPPHLTMEQLPLFWVNILRGASLNRDTPVEWRTATISSNLFSSAFKEYKVIKPHDIFRENAIGRLIMKRLPLQVCVDLEHSEPLHL